MEAGARLRCVAMGSSEHGTVLAEDLPRDGFSPSYRELRLPSGNSVTLSNHPTCCAVRLSLVDSEGKQLDCIVGRDERETREVYSESRMGRWK